MANNHHLSQLFCFSCLRYFFSPLSRKSIGLTAMRLYLLDGDGVCTKMYIWLSSCKTDFLYLVTAFNSASVENENWWS